jgi:hypothetical protein
MKRFSLAAGIMLAVVTVLGPAGHAAAGEQVPFKGTVEGSVNRTLLDPPFAFDRFDITGDATQLGEFDLVIGALVDLSTRTAMGTYEFVAANGDTLSADFLGSSMPTANPGVVLITEVAIVTGGTGRFAGASGSFICKRLFEPATGMTIGSIQGTVSSPGAMNP